MHDGRQLALAEPTDLGPRDPQLPLIGLDQSPDQAQQRALAGTAPAHDDRDPATRKRTGEVGQDRPTAERLVDADEADMGLGRRRRTPRGGMGHGGSH